MRGADHQQDGLFSYLTLESRIPASHPLRPIRHLVDQALRQLSPLFDQLYAADGRVSIPPERLMRAQLLQILYGIPSERRLMEQIDFNLLFRWFVGLTLDEPVWHPTTFTHNRDRLLTPQVADQFFLLIRAQAGAARLLSRDHFTVDGTLIDAAASLKSFKPKAENDQDEPPAAGGRNEDVNFHGKKRSNKTHQSTTDPDARLARKGKGKEAKLCYAGHVLTENRHGLIVQAEVTLASGTAEREAALSMLDRQKPGRRVTLAADKGYDSKDFVQALRQRRVTPHIARKKTSGLDGRTTRHAGYAISQRRRKLVEECFGWMKTVGLMRKLRHRGLEKVKGLFTFAAAAYNLVRLRSLQANGA